MSQKPPIRNCTMKKPRNLRLLALTEYVRLLDRDLKNVHKRLDMLEAFERTRSAAEQARTQDERIREENRKGPQAHEA